MGNRSRGLWRAGKWLCEKEDGDMSSHRSGNRGSPMRNLARKPRTEGKPKLGILVALSLEGWMAVGRRETRVTSLVTNVSDAGDV